MPTVIDALILEIGLDPSKFTAGQKQLLDNMTKTQDQALKFGKQVESESKKINEFFGGLKREVLGFLGLAFGGAELKNFITNLTNLDAATGRTARNLNIGTKELSAWQGAAEQTGGSAEGITSALQGLNTQLFNFRAGVGSDLPGKLRVLGINVFDVNGQLKTADDLLREIAHNPIFEKLSARDKAGFAQLLGLNQDAINLIVRGGRELDASLAQIGGATEESAAQAQQYQEEMGKLSRAAENTGRTLLVQLAPALTSILRQLRETVQTGGLGGKTLWEFLTSPPEFGIKPGSAADAVRNWFTGGPKSLRDLYGGVSGSSTFDPSMETAKSKLADLMKGYKGGTGGGGNWTNFLSGLSYLETSQTGAPNPGSSARGYFQFLQGTAAKAVAAGISDPRSGSYDQQADSTMRYIKKFYPEAASAIDRGDFGAASVILRGEWPSLPGGSQQQSAQRYQTWQKELQGGGPRPPSGAADAAAAFMSTRGGDTSSSSSSSVSVGQVIVNTQAKDADGIAKDIKPALERSSFASQANYGQQ